MHELKGRVIRIVDKRTAIINAGSADGVTNTTTFQILGEPEPIIDPVDGKVLGEVVVLKAKLEPSQIHEHFTIARTPDGVSALSRMLNSVPGGYSEPTEMIVNANDLKPWVAQSKTPVIIGDEVLVLIPGDQRRPAADTSQQSATGE